MNSKRITFSRNGEWGIEGVDLTILPPRAYGAICKLKDIENAVERMNSAGLSGDSPAMALFDLLGLLGVDKYAV